MEMKIISASIVEQIGEYGIAKIKTELLLNTGKVFRRKTIYDVCLEHGYGDIVASFSKISEARKWAKEN
jgi:hypothetical protein